MKRGQFITLEGGEGAGKSTQLKLLAEALGRAGQAHLLTREPGGTASAEKIRELLVSTDIDLNAAEQTLLFLAARSAHLREVIYPALEKGVIVLCDRFADSTLVYQGIASGLGMDYVEALSKLAIGACDPDLTLLLDMDPQEGLNRARARGKDQRFEQYGLAFHEKLRNGFLALAKQEPERIAVIDASNAPEKVHADICAAIAQRLNIRL